MTLSTLRAGTSGKSEIPPEILLGGGPCHETQRGRDQRGAQGGRERGQGPQGRNPNPERERTDGWLDRYKDR